MATPRPVTYRVGSGGTVYGGRMSPTPTVNLTGTNSSQAASSGVGAISFPMVGAPAWLAGAAINNWIEIPGTDEAANPAALTGARLIEFSGLARAGTKLIAAASGGHSYGDNRVVGIDLAADAPAWSLLNPPSALADQVQAVPYYNDGKPISRHTRYNIHWLSALNRVVLLTVRDYYAGSPGSLPNVDGFNLDTNQWDAAGTYPSLPSTTAIDGGACVDANGDGWVFSCTYKFTAATKTWSQPLTTTAPKRVRYPWALDTNRSQMFGLCFGDGWGYDAASGICAIKQVGNVQTQVTFNPSAAVDAFIAEFPKEAGMAYDPFNDYFLFYGDQVAGRFYKIIPNETAVWDMEIASFGGVTPVASTAGTQSRIHYIPSLKGFAVMPQQTRNIYFVRTA